MVISRFGSKESYRKGKRKEIIFSQFFPDSSNLSNALEILIGGEGLGVGKSRGSTESKESERLCIYRLCLFRFI